MSENKLPVLAVTGGIGAGKSFVCNIFASLHGIPVYDSDSHAKSLYDTDPLLLSEIKKIAGDDIVSPDGHLLRRVLADRIFNDGGMLEAVEAEVFPAVMRDFERWKAVLPCGPVTCGEKDASQGPCGIAVRPPFVIIESAIFLSRPVLYPMADKVLYVDAPLELRIERVMRRDNVQREAVLARISGQSSVDLSRADWIINTSMGRESIVKSVSDIVVRLGGKKSSK